MSTNNDVGCFTSSFLFVLILGFITFESLFDFYFQVARDEGSRRHKGEAYLGKLQQGL